MDQSARLSAVIGSLYDAALDPVVWTTAICEARDFVGGSAASIFAKDVAQTTLTVFHDDGNLGQEFDHMLLGVECDGPWIADVGFGGWLLPLLGFIFLPYATLAYAGAILLAGSVTPLWLVLIILAVLVDIAHWGGGYKRRRRRRR